MAVQEHGEVATRATASGTMKGKGEDKPRVILMEATISSGRAGLLAAVAAEVVTRDAARVPVVHC